MIYLLYGEDLYLKKQKIVEITKDIDKNSISWVDFNDDEWEEILKKSQTNSLFGDKQAIIVNDFVISSDFEKNNLSLLETYLKNPNPNTMLILNSNCGQIEKRKKTFKLLKQKGTIFSFLKNENVFEETKKLFDNLKISDQNIRYFITLVGVNHGIIKNEIIKLKNYQDNGEITKEIIDQVSSKYQEPNLWALIDAVVNKDVPKAFSHYEVLLKYNEEPIKIIIAVANQLRIIYQVKKLKNMSYSNDDIAKKLNIHPYRVKLAVGKSKTYQSKQIVFLLNQLADYDIAIKTGKIEKELAFEYFMLNLEKQF